MTNPDERLAVAVHAACWQTACKWPQCGCERIHDALAAYDAAHPPQPREVTEEALDEASLATNWNMLSAPLRTHLRRAIEAAINHPSMQVSGEDRLGWQSAPTRVAPSVFSPGSGQPSIAELHRRVAKAARHDWTVDGLRKSLAALHTAIAAREEQNTCEK